MKSNEELIEQYKKDSEATEALAASMGLKSGTVKEMVTLEQMIEKPIEELELILAGLILHEEFAHAETVKAIIIRKNKYS